jgi:hypothetical protein
VPDGVVEDVPDEELLPDGEVLQVPCVGDALLAALGSVEDFSAGDPVPEPAAPVVPIPEADPEVEPVLEEP